MGQRLAVGRRCGGRRGPSPRAGRRTRWRASSSSFTWSSRPSSASVTSSPSAHGLARCGPARRPGGSRPSRGSGSSSASASSAATAVDQQLGQRDDGLLVVGLEGQDLPQRRLVAGGQQRRSTASSASVGSRPSTNSRTSASGWAPTKPSTTLPSLSAYTAGIDCTWNAWRHLRVLVDVDLGQHDLAVGLVDHLLEDRAERLARPAPRRPTGRRRRGPARSARRPRSGTWHR